MCVTYAIIGAPLARIFERFHVKRLQSFIAHPTTSFTLFTFCNAIISCSGVLLNHPSGCTKEMMPITRDYHTKPSMIPRPQYVTATKRWFSLWISHANNCSNNSFGVFLFCNHITPVSHLITANLLSFLPFPCVRYHTIQTSVAQCQLGYLYVSYLSTTFTQQVLRFFAL